jgi:hypothetical protein
MHIKPVTERSPFFLFLPLLFIYSVYVYYFHTDQMTGDEVRYIQFAQNLLNGFYSPSYPNIDLINGPGYPILLLPFIGLKLPLFCITLFNAVLYYLSVVFLFKTVHILTSSFKTACIVALCWGINILAYQEMPCILTECFTLFLISLFSYQIIKIYSTSSITYRSIGFAGFTLGFLILTKVIFAYVVCVLLLLTMLFYFLQKRPDKLLKIVCILSISIGTITPYLIYTYSLTGKFFYLSSEGGKVLYWMTSLDAHEYGDWNNNSFTANCSNTIFCNAAYIAKNHASEIKRIQHSKSVLEVDSLFKEYAIQHIKANPLKYVKNWYANIGRLLFGFPASYYFQSPTTLIRIYINSILLLAMVYSLIIAMWNWKTLPLEIKILIGFSIVYLGLSSLVSAYPRQFNVMVPAILIWITYALKNTVRVQLKM